MRLVARCLRGIEWICAAELAAAGAHVEAVEHRLVECRAAPGPALLGAGTVDDLFLLGLRLTGAGRQRTALAEVRAQVERLEAGPLLAAVEAVRPLPADAPFEVVASFLGRRNYSRFEIERAAGEGLERALGRRFVPGPLGADEHPPLSWRVHLYDEGGFLGLRLAAAPLHRRPYKLDSLAGTLHPPLARAAAALGGVAPGDRVLDPFCGAGTMLLEAGGEQPAARLVGADIAAGAVRSAGANAERAGVRAALLVADAGRLPLADGAAGVVLTNPPWSRRLAPAGSLAGGLEPFWREAARVTAGRVVVVLEELEDQAEPIAAAGLEPVVLQRVAVSGAWTTLGLLAPAGRRRAELARLAALGLRPMSGAAPA
ncbi:MAG: methyltransferase domain-containing protein [Chloroflexi bacterium]|nr:MAG: methyltransferase domain-containing protein [Chloroflexota bacterium]